MNLDIRDMSRDALWISAAVLAWGLYIFFCLWADGKLGTTPLW